MREVSKWLNQPTPAGSDESKTTHTRLFFLKDRMSKLQQIAAEIDQDYESEC